MVYLLLIVTIIIHHRVLTDEGVEYLRNFLHLPADIIPATHKQIKSTRLQVAEQEMSQEQGKDQGPGRNFRPSFKSGGEGGFGRGGKRV